jgi:hypothetical protein
MFKRMPFYTNALLFDKIKPVMTGVTVTPSGNVTHFGASFSSVRPSQKFEAEERDRRRKMLGKYFEYDQFVQSNLKNGVDPLSGMPEDLMEIRKSLNGVNWVVWRAGLNHQTLHPQHLEPMCRA